ncbi:MAG: DUF4974 domain-containing protein [Planctomycetes bacterium]|nr:DUF4974 domain-containing protein [Planctomycetota bacterium]
MDSFLKGGERAREELLLLGPFAIRHLQRSRHKNPPKFDALIHEIRRDAAYPAFVPVPDHFEGPVTVYLNFEGKDDLVGIIQLLHKMGLPVYFDRFKTANLIHTQVSIPSSRSPLELIDRLCLFTGLDYGFFHNAVVIGMPERFWPSKGPPKASDLDAAALQRARELVEELDDESIEVRESATRELVRLGMGVRPLLEAQRNRKEVEIVSRCAAIIRCLRLPWLGAFGPAACLRQQLSAVDQRVLEHVRIVRPNLTFDKATLCDIMIHLQKNHGVDYAITGDHGRHVVTMASAGQTLLDLLSLITQSNDLDFIVKDRKLIIDTREGIEKRLCPSK